MPKKRSGAGRPARTVLDSFIQHGVDLGAPVGGQAIGDCPFCEKRRKFYVNAESGVWDCKRCSRSGNVKTFFALKAKVNAAALKGGPAGRLAKDRGVLPGTLRKWRVGWDGQQYTIPVDMLGKLYDLRRYTIGGKVRSSTGGNVSLAGVEDTDSGIVWLCEGEWDGMALWEALQSEKTPGPGSVVICPGAGTFPAHAVPYFQNKRVYVCFDHDDAGERGGVRIYNMLTNVAAELKFVHWPEGFPDGYDVRDLYHRRGKATVAMLKKLLQPTAPGAVKGSDGALGGAPSKPEVLDGKGLSRDETIKGFRKWLYLPDPELLSVIFGSVFANRLDGDPVWMFLVAPPGGSKSVTLMPLSSAPRIMSTTSLTPHTLVSGATMVGNADPSLIPQLDGKVLVIKDFTTILDLPIVQRDEIFGTLRDAYDGKTEKRWGTGMHRVYHSKFGILAGVTPIIETYGAASSMLGERFLRYRLPTAGRLVGNEALIRAALANIGKETRMQEELGKVARDVLNVEVDVNPGSLPKLTKAMTERILLLAQWVSVLRGVVRRERYTQNVEFKPTQEIGTRIAKQLARLGMGVAIFHRVKTINEEVYQVIVSVARSTTPDRVEEVVKQLYLRSRKRHVTVAEMSVWANLPVPTVRSLLWDLELLRIVQQGDTVKNSTTWRLSRTVLRLMRPLHLYKKEERWDEARRGGKSRGKANG